jgi:peptidoglycan biosynthesis protein MviN/MurJ (putative lipid II flippase)
MRISVFCLALNAVLALALISHFKQAGLALANSLTSFVNVTLLLYALRLKLKKLELAGLRRQVAALLGAAVVAGASAWGTSWWWGANMGHQGLAFQLGDVFVPMSVASVVYLAVAAWLRTKHTDELMGMVRGWFGRR